MLAGDAASSRRPARPAGPIRCPMASHAVVANNACIGTLRPTERPVSSPTLWAGETMMCATSRRTLAMHSASGACNAYSLFFDSRRWARTLAACNGRGRVDRRWLRSVVTGYQVVGFNRHGDSSRATARPVRFQQVRKTSRQWSFRVPPSMSCRPRAIGSNTLPADAPHFQGPKSVQSCRFSDGVPSPNDVSFR